MRVKDRVAIVTGSAMGIGKGIASVLAREGAKVVLADVNAEEGERTAAELRRSGGETLFLHTDVGDEAQVRGTVQRTVDRYGSLSILVNNAAVGVYTPVHETTLEAWERCLRINLTGPFLCSKYALPHLKAAGGGAIVNIASVHAHQNVGGTAPYAASKGGLAALTRVMAIDYAHDGIRVNAICPGWIYTPLIQGIFKASGDPEGMKRTVERRQLLGRLGTPEDIGNAVLYLVSEESSYVTGASLFVDSGMTALLETW